MKHGSKNPKQLDTPNKVKYKQIYWSNEAQRGVFNSVQSSETKTPSFCQKIYFSIKLLHAHVRHVCKILKRFNDSSKRKWFHKVCTINHYFLDAVFGKWQSSKPCHFVKKYSFNITLLHAYLQQVCNIYAKYLRDSMRALRGVDFT